MKTLKIKNKTIHLDDKDYEVLKDEVWHINTYGYVARWKRKSEGDGSNILYMSRIIVNAPKGFVVDHINGNKLDNRKLNLRICSHRQNMMNQRPQKGRSSIYKGVSLCKRSGKFRAYITVNKKFKSIGTFELEEDAANAYNIEAKNIFGEYANFNNVNNSLLEGSF